ncbi:MAG: cytochrome P450 [Acidimicrobiales bacterium]|nr:cytochrome P450 [Acidimicrobiales bacterium]
MSDLPVVDYDPFSPEVMADPLPVYRALRDAGRAHPLPRYDAWALPRFDDVWQVGQDRERCSIAEGPIFSKDRLAEPFVGRDTEEMPHPLPSFSTLDPPVHTRLRRSLVDPFRPRSVAALEASVRAHARSLLDELVPRGRFDAVSELGSPVATAAVCRLLGIDGVDLTHVTRLVNTSTLRDPRAPGATETGRAAQAELAGIITDHVASVRSNDPLVDSIAAVDAGGQRLSDNEIAVQLSTLLVGGAETLPKILAGGLLRFHRHPDQWALLRREPALAANAFEEIMRLESVLQWVGRTLTVDAEIAGTRMRAGQRLFLLLVSANHDEREFPDPERFDVARKFTRTLVFGHGVHFCIGAHAARLEGRILFEELLRVLSEFGVDETEAVRPPSEFQLGYTRLPVTC